MCFDNLWVIYLSPFINDQHWYMICPLWPLLLTWFNLNPSMDKSLDPQKSVGWNYLSITKLQRLHRLSLGMDK